MLRNNRMVSAIRNGALLKGVGGPGSKTRAKRAKAGYSSQTQWLYDSTVRSSIR